jgi:UPF0755 protein
MSPNNFNDSEKRLEEQRRQRAAQFRLNIDENYDDIPDEPSELNSYSGQDVKEQIARDSKHALKKKRKAEKKERKAHDKHNRRIFRVLWIVSVVIIGAMAAMFIITGMNDMLAINRTDETTVQIEIPENPSLETVAAELDKNGIIDEPTYFKLFANLTKSADDFTQGTYEMRKNMDYEAIINYLLSSANRTDIISVTITEGENVLEIANTLKENGALNDVDKFMELCNSDQFDEDFSFLADIKNGTSRYYKLEGYLYPDTYNFYENEDPESIIYKFLNNYESRINEKQTVDGYSKKVSILKMIEESGTKYSLDEIMNIASIIQAEAANVDDMYYISSILHNRIEADSSLGVSNLGLDSTRYYPYRTADDLPDSVGKDYVSNYDTYDKVGLPDGPICNPGMDAIIAAINPNSTDYYFFCHDSSGNAYYASTLYEQNANLEYIEYNDL